MVELKPLIGKEDHLEGGRIKQRNMCDERGDSGGRILTQTSRECLDREKW